MEWTQFLIMLITVAGLFFWNRSESRTDARQAHDLLKSNTDLIVAMKEEIRDFHGRLCSLEERRK